MSTWDWGAGFIDFSISVVNVLGLVVTHPVRKAISDSVAVTFQEIPRSLLCFTFANLKLLAIFATSAQYKH